MSTGSLSTEPTPLPPLPPGGRVGLLGGSFNPPHIAHALLALSVLSVGEVDAVWVIPCGDHPFGKALAPFADRLHMTKLAFSYLGDRVHILDVEAQLPKPTYTVATVRHLLSRAPGLAPRWIVGSDILDELPLWREPESLQVLAPLLVIPRAGHRGEGLLDFSLPELSSSAIRARLGRREPVRGSVDHAVVRYIEAQGLYQDRVTGAASGQADPAR